jgi:elongator complex protein 1
VIQYLVTVTHHNEFPDEVGNLLPHLFQFTEEHRREAASLQQDLDQVEQEIKGALAEVWANPTDTPIDATPDSWAVRMEERESARQTNPTDRVPKPDIVEVEWRLKVLHGDLQ